MDAIAGKVIERLTSLALDKLGLIWNLKGDVERMNGTVSTIRAKLLDAEAKALNHEISDWLEKLKDVFFDVDDLLDDVSTQALRKKVMTGNKMAKEVKLFFSHSNQIAYGLKLVHKMKEIRKRLADIYNDKIQPQLTVCHHMETSVVNRRERETYSFVAGDDVIGREKEKKLVLSYLLDTNLTEGVSVIPIVGIGGLGKTALAQLVYNDEAVKKYFDLKMWVCVSEEFSVRQIAQKMLGHTQQCQLEQVQQDLRKKIEGKKFLLILDDVWNDDRELWLELRSLLMKGAKGSMIIVTTRIETVAEIMHTHETLFLKGLDEDKSWQLFSRVAFHGGKEPNDPQLVTIGKDIVRKCFGVPLAIRTIGSLLYCKELSVKDWLYFKDTELSKIDEEKNRIFGVLKLSYDHLGSNLKNCFAYCSLFPKDFEIERETLIQLWIAQGFIPTSDQTRQPEHVRDEYFMNLLSRYFFQDVTRGRYGDIITCKMHDLIHDLVVQVTKNECVTISKGKGENIGHRLRHLSFDFRLELPNRELQTSLLEAKKSRTFLLPFGAEYRGEENPLAVPFCVKPLLNKSVLSSLTSSLKCLRVLVFQKSGLTTISKTIGKLKHLRYLDLSYNDAIKKLPQSITKLHNLQTLKLSFCYMLEELPRGINKLVSLRHLELDDCNSLRWMPQGLGQLTCLQTLTCFVLDHQRSGSARISHLSGLSNLRGKLRIEGLRHLQGNTAEIESAKVFLEKQCFQELQLCWNHVEDPVFEDEMILRGGKLCHTIKSLSIDKFCGKSLLDSLGNLSLLNELHIESCNSLTSLPDSFGNHSLLKLLRIVSCNSLTSLADSFGNLSSLNELDIRYCSSLTSLADSFGNLSSLNELHIESCNSLTSLPDSFENLSSLKELRIVFCDSLTSLSNSFGNLLSLKELDIVSCNSLTSLSDTFGNLSSLQELNIESCNSLTSLPESFGNLSSLNKLHIMSCNSLTSLADSFGNLPSLNELHIESCNSLTSLPESFGNISSLNEIHIESCNSLTSLPESFGNLSSLNKLYIKSCNSFTLLQDSFRNLSSLQVLDISFCDSSCNILTSLVDSFGNLSSLEKLYIKFCNSLTLLLDSFGNLSSLQELYIVSCNSLTSLPDSFGNFSSIKKLLIMSCNSLTLLPDSFGNLSSLQELRIGSCGSLTSLPDSFGNLSSLQELCIGFCDSLTSLPDSFGNLSSLIELHIVSCNSLTLLPDSFANLSSLKKLRILSCDSLTSLSDSFGNLSSLQKLYFESCDSWTSLPDSCCGIPSEAFNH